MHNLKQILLKIDPNIKDINFDRFERKSGFYSDEKDPTEYEKCTQTHTIETKVGDRTKRKITEVEVYVNAETDEEMTKDEYHELVSRVDRYNRTMEEMCKEFVEQYKKGEDYMLKTCRIDYSDPYDYCYDKISVDTKKYQLQMAGFIFAALGYHTWRSKYKEENRAFGDTYHYTVLHAANPNKKKAKTDVPDDPGCPGC